MTAKSVLMHPKACALGPVLPLASSCYATMFKAISTGLKIHSFMYLILLCLLLKK